MSSDNYQNDDWHQGELQWVEDTITLAFSMATQVIFGAVVAAVDMYNEATKEE
jgi:hypothetical protein